MARPVSISDETILDAARQVFLERGIQATTAEVAERASVSEGSIFKRFKSKIGLFRAAMGEQLDEPSWLKQLPHRVGRHEDLREGLFELGMEIVDFFRELMPLVMMNWSNPGADGLPAIASEPDPPPLRALKSMTAFFEAEMRAGRLRRHDPEIIARTFVGGLNHFVFMDVVFRGREELPLAQATYVRGLVNLLWKGIDPTTQGK
jgi:AcrR family transcriptional regulator